MSDASNRPESVRSKRVNDNSIYTFPAKQFPHGIQFIFMDYDYNRFINTLTASSTTTTKTDADGNQVKETSTTIGDIGKEAGVKKLGLVPASNVPPEIKDYTVLELPFPRQLTDSNQINNTAFERSFMVERLTAGLAAAGQNEGAGGVLGSAASMAKNILAEIRKVGSGQENNILDKFSGILTNEKNLGAGTQAAKFLAKSFLPSDILKQFGQASGQLINPLQTLAFTGVDLKQYSFTWDLFPTNQADSDRLKKIIQLLKNKSLPAVSGVVDGENNTVGGLSRAFLKYPSVVRTNFIGVDESHFVRFKPAMLTQVNVDYAGNAGTVVIARGGRPAAITLTLAFTELTIHTADDYPLDDKPDTGATSAENDTNNAAGGGPGAAPAA